MLSVALKNFVLVLLLLSIVHIMLNNHFNQINIMYMNESVPPENDKCVRQHSDVEIVNSESEDKNPTDTTRDNDDTTCDDQLTHNKELYDFVYGDDQAEAGLDKIFESVSRTVFPKDDCIDAHHKSKTLQPIIETNDDSPISTTKGNPILYEYERQDGVFNGYESFGSSFMILGDDH